MKYKKAASQGAYIDRFSEQEILDALRAAKDEDLIEYLQD